VYYPDETLQQLISLLNEHRKTNPTIGSDDIEQMWAHVNGLPWSKGHSITDVPRYPQNWKGPVSTTGYSIKKLTKKDPHKVKTASVKLTTRFNIPQILTGVGFRSATEAGQAFLQQWTTIVNEAKLCYPDHRTVLFLFSPEHDFLVMHEQPTVYWNFRNYRWVYADESKRNIHGLRPTDGVTMFSIQLNDNRLHRRIELNNRLLIDLSTRTVTSDVVDLLFDDSPKKEEEVHAAAAGANLSAIFED
jgi:hypothetical protein